MHTHTPPIVLTQKARGEEHQVTETSPRPPFLEASKEEEGNGGHISSERVRLQVDVRGRSGKRRGGI